ncbi:MAG: toprim domain-containing protein, partial [Pseudoflavonifractor sp.]
MLRIKEAIVVEGRYDKNTLSQMVDGVILETSGFGIFKNEEQLALLRRLAETRGLIVLTDSDGAGFVIRNFLKGAIP